MPALLDHKVLFVTGKGGAGKTTISAALGLTTAAAGKRTIVCEVGAQRRIPVLLGDAEAQLGEERRVGQRLWSLSVDKQRTLADWLPHEVGSRAVARVLLASDTFQYIAAAAAGSTEIVNMTAVWELVQRRRWDKAARPYDLAVVDSPASGELVGMLRTPRTYGTVVRAGPIAAQARQLRALFEDPDHSAVIAVTHASELSVNETLELEAWLRRQVGFGLAIVVVNAMFPRRFSPGEMRRLSVEAGHDDGDEGPAARAGRSAAQSGYRRWREQHKQLSRLRRRIEAPVITVPFVFAAAIERPAIESVARVLERRLPDV